MRLLTSGAVLVLVLAAVAADKKPDTSPMLLGADDVDKKHAEMSAGEAPEVPETISEIKRKTKAERHELKSLKYRVHNLKKQIKDGKSSLGAAEIKTLKREYKQLKESMRTKKHDIGDLKKKMIHMKSEKRSHKQGKKGHRRGGRRNKQSIGQLIGAEEKKINSPESFGLKPEPDTTALLTKKERKAQRRLNKKTERRRNKQREEGHSLKGVGMMSNSMPKLRNLDINNIVPRRFKGGHHSHKKRLCTSDDDCTRGKCLPNYKGRKVCQVTDKPAGRKCHKSEVCARGLKCYVSNSSVPSGKHRRTKGVCADPKTADLANGYLIPYKS